MEFEDYHTYEIAMHFYDSEDDDIAFTVAIFSPS